MKCRYVTRENFLIMHSFVAGITTAYGELQKRKITNEDFYDISINSILETLEKLGLSEKGEKNDNI